MPDRYHRDLVASKLGVVCFHSLPGSLKTGSKAATKLPSVLLLVNLICDRGKEKKAHDLL